MSSSTHGDGMEHEFIGWCHEDNHDKVWGIVRLKDHDRWDAEYVSFWGRRGRKIQTKQFREDPYKVRQLIASKRQKGYKQVRMSELDTVYPEFRNDIEKTTVWAILKL